ncbi:phosphodiester glycosidase family protein [Pendulispora albinea]|uniref:Phosphodiester glycosidase family protein n=1 Tax=Pendulispora albinea TaxID=2741071 RepID=A0ABZ2LPT2_9BACT
MLAAPKNRLALRCAVIAAGILAIPGCSRNGRAGTETSTAGAADAAVLVARPEAATSPWNPDIVRSGSESYPLRRFSYALKDVTLGIEDIGMRASLREILEQRHALLAVNGGFFDTHGMPLGLAVSNGRVLASFVPSLSGGVLGVDRGRGWLEETESFLTPSPAVDFAIQCRPRLVVAGNANIRSDDGKRAARTAICLRDAGAVVDFIIVRGDLGRADPRESEGRPGPSLFALAHHLAQLGCQEALNLDGGPSTGAAFWEDGKMRHLAPRAPIRHAILVRPRRDAGR